MGKSKNKKSHGVGPCPKCKSKFRVPVEYQGISAIECDDCGFTEYSDEDDADYYGRDD